MKKITSKILLFSMLMGLMSIQSGFSQANKYDLIMKELTKEQKALLRKEKEMIKNNRETLKKSLTKEQLRILSDKTLSLIHI